VAAAAVFFLNAVGGGRAATHSPTLGRVLSALGQRAARSDAMPSTDRKLFYTRIAYRDLAVRVDARRGPWAARYRQVVRRWVAADGSARLLFHGGSETLVGPRDRARWRADGLPPLDESTGRIWEVDYRAGRFVGANLRAPHLTFEDLRGLPMDESALSERVDELLPPEVGARHERVKLEAIAELIGANPTPPATRAALYRVLARLDGLRREGTQTDPYGRRGLGFAVADDAAKTIVVVDPASARVLGMKTLTRRRLPYADVRPGDVISEHWFLAARFVSTFRGHLVRRSCRATGNSFGCWVWSS
jgi:hypothetical protein